MVIKAEDNVQCKHCNNYIIYDADRKIWDLASKDRILDCKHEQHVSIICNFCGDTYSVNSDRIFTTHNGRKKCMSCSVVLF